MRHKVIIRKSCGLGRLERIRISKVLPYVHGRLLDIGCGYNNLVRNYDGEGIGVDVFPWDGVDIIVKDSTNMSCFPNSSFDTISLIACLNHIIKREQVLREAYRLLKSGGRLLVTMIPYRIGELWHRYFERYWGEKKKGRSFANGETGGIDSGNVMRMIKNAGFIIEKREKFKIWQCLWLFFVLVVTSIIFSYIFNTLPTKTWRFASRKTYVLIPVFILFTVYGLDCFRKWKIVYYFLAFCLLAVILNKDIPRDIRYLEKVPGWTYEHEELVSAVSYIGKNLKKDDTILAPEECYFCMRTGLRCYNLSVAFSYAQLLERAGITHSDYLVIWSANDLDTHYGFLYDDDYYRKAPELELLEEFRGEKTSQVVRIFRFR